MMGCPRITDPNFAILQLIVRGGHWFCVGNHRSDGVMFLGFSRHSYGSRPVLLRMLGTALLVIDIVLSHVTNTLTRTADERACEFTILLSIRLTDICVSRQTYRRISTLGFWLRSIGSVCFGPQRKTRFISPMFNAQLVNERFTQSRRGSCVSSST